MGTGGDHQSRRCISQVVDTKVGEEAGGSDRGWPHPLREVGVAQGSAWLPR